MSQSPLRVLLVEDDPDIRAIAEMALGMVGGMDVTSCADGEEALRVFPEAIPDIVLLDVMMPHMDGPEVLEALRTLPGGETIPVLFMTARVRSEDVRWYAELGAVGIIAKPFDPMTLAEDVRRHVAEAGTGGAGERGA